MFCTILAYVGFSRGALGMHLGSGWVPEWILGAGASNGGIAQSCDDLWATCTEGCGDYAVFPDCRDRGGSCTPYSFMPNSKDNQDCSFMDDGYFSSQPFFEYSNEFSYQAFAAKKADGSWEDDIWILHGCDGAGIQTDCRGDIMYLEHFGSHEPVTGQECPPSVYGKTHERCPTFYHQGYGQSYRDYTCGWWRGYDSAVGVEKASVQDGIGAFGPAAAKGDIGGDYSASMKSILANCPTCAWGSALIHPYANTGAIAYFTGALWPWICNEGGDKYIPYTGQQETCYCDNEPSNGRKPWNWPAGVPYTPLYPKDTQIVYCGLYNDNVEGLELKCDFITLNPGANMAQADFRGVSMYPTNF